MWPHLSQANMTSYSDQYVRILWPAMFLVSDLKKKTKKTHHQPETNGQETQNNCTQFSTIFCPETLKQNAQSYQVHIQHLLVSLVIAVGSTSSST